ASTVPILDFGFWILDWVRATPSPAQTNAPAIQNLKYKIQNRLIVSFFSRELNRFDLYRARGWIQRGHHACNQYQQARLDQKPIQKMKLDSPSKRLNVDHVNQNQR